MKRYYFALIIGVIAGIIDVTPMIIQNLSFSACLSAFVHWVVLGLIIPFVDWPMKPWLKGLIIAELSAIPILIIVIPQQPASIIPITVFSALLGMGVGSAGARFVK
jgi:hypothetical protein